MDVCLTRWKVEEKIRFNKPSSDLEDLGVLTSERPKNLALLVFAGFYFGAVCLGTRAKLEIPASPRILGGGSERPLAPSRPQAAASAATGPSRYI